MLIIITLLLLVIFVLLRQKSIMRKQLQNLKKDYEQLWTTNQDLQNSLRNGLTRNK